MVRSPNRNRLFSKPIALRDGAHLVSLADAAKFLKELRPVQVTAPLYYASALLNEAIEEGRAGKVERARSELIRAFRGEGWL